MAMRFVPALLIVGLLAGAVAVAAAEGPAYLVPPQVRFAFNAHLTPRRLSRHLPGAARIRVGARVSVEDGSQPPALQELVLELDRSITIDAAGMPICRLLPQEARTGFRSGRHSGCGRRGQPRPLWARGGGESAQDRRRLRLDNEPHVEPGSSIRT